MRAVLTLLKDELQTATPVVNLVGTECYAIVAPQETGKLFLVYTVSEDEPLTKDGVSDHTIRLTASAEDVDVLLDLMDATKQAMDTLSVYVDYQGSSEIQQETDQHYIINLNYNITL